MALLTVFLLVLVFALLLGHFFLEITRTKSHATAGNEFAKEKEYGEKNTRHNTLPNSSGKEAAKNAVSIAGSFETQRLLMPSDTANSRVLSTIIERLDRLEKILHSANQAAGKTGLLQGKKMEGGFHKRLQSLIDFKHETRIEVAALKEEVRQIKARLGIGGKQGQPVPEIDRERLRELVYNVRK